jgi:hypothetical protein
MKITKEYLETHGVEVEAATLHQSVHLPIIGSTDKTISDSKSGFKGSKKVLIPQGLYIEVGGRSFIVPSAALGGLMLPVDTETKTEKKK